MNVSTIFRPFGSRASWATGGRGGLSLRWRLVLLVVASIVPLLAFSLAHEYLGYREEVAASGQETLMLARSMSLLIDEELQARVAVLQSLAVSRALQAGEIERFRAQAEAVVAEQFPDGNILLLKEDGEQIMNTFVPAGAPIPARPNVELTRQVFATGRPAVSNIFQGAVRARPVVAIDVPVKGSDGAVSYVLSLSPNLQAFAEVIRRQNLPANWVISVIDRRGVIIARIPNGDRFVGHEVASGSLQTMQAQREGVGEFASLEGTRLLVAFSHAERFGWAVAIGVPETVLARAALSGATRTLGVGGGLLAVSLALALYVAQRIAGPIEALRRVAATTEHDALPDVLPTGLREVDEVAQALRAAEDDRRRSRRAEVLLRDSIETMLAGFVIFDDEDRLVMCNQSYRGFLPESSEGVVPGTRFEDILLDSRLGRPRSAVKSPITSSSGKSPARWPTRCAFSLQLHAVATYRGSILL